MREIVISNLMRAKNKQSFLLIDLEGDKEHRFRCDFDSYFVIKDDLM